MLNDVLLAVGKGEQPPEGRGALQQQLEEAMSITSEKGGGSLSLLFWRPPAGWAPGGAAVAAGDGALPQLESEEKVNVIRLCKRLQNRGSSVSKANLSRIAAKLGVDPSGQKEMVETRIEMKLRSLRFADDNEFRPTAADCLLTGDELEDRLDACPIYTISSLERQLERVMQACGADARARVGAADAQPQTRRQRT